MIIQIDLENNGEISAEYKSVSELSFDADELDYFSRHGVNRINDNIVYVDLNSMTPNRNIKLATLIKKYRIFKIKQIL